MLNIHCEKKTSSAAITTSLPTSWRGTCSPVQLCFARKSSEAIGWGCGRNGKMRLNLNWFLSSHCCLGQKSLLWGLAMESFVVGWDFDLCNVNCIWKWRPLSLLCIQLLLFHLLQTWHICRSFHENGLMICFPKTSRQKAIYKCWSRWSKTRSTYELGKQVQCFHNGERVWREEWWWRNECDKLQK